MKSELLHGTLEVIVLKTLSWGPMHGYGIGRWIEQLGTGALRSRKGPKSIWAGFAQAVGQVLAAREQPAT
jgi:hypothetical protein